MNRLVIIISFLGCSFVAAQDTCQKQVGVNYPGYDDLGQIPNVQNPDDCCTLCLNHPSCVASVYQTAGVYAKRCWLKFKLGYSTNDARFITYSTLIPGCNVTEGIPYFIQSRKSGKVLQPSNENATWGNEVQRSISSGNYSFQLWYFRGTGAKNTYYIYNFANGLFADVQYGAPDENAPIVDYYDIETASHQFTANGVSNAPGLCTFRAAHSGKMITVKDGSLDEGAPVTQNKFSKGAQEQQFQIIPACPQTIPLVSNGAITYPAPAFNGTVATMSCNAGYAPGPGAATSLTCTNGIWSPASFGSCVPTCPQNIANVANGAISYSSPTYAGTAANLTCNDGFYPIPGTTTSAACTAAGTWSSASLGGCDNTCKKLVNTNYPGNDDMSPVNNVPDEDQCCNICLNKPPCVIAVYEKATHKCWLKNVLGTPTSDPGFTSYNTIIPGCNIQLGIPYYIQSRISGKVVQPQTNTNNIVPLVQSTQNNAAGVNTSYQLWTFKSTDFTNTYFIQNLGNGYYFDVEYSATDNGHELIQYYETPNPNHQFTSNGVASATGYCTFKADNSGDLVTVQGGSVADGTIIVQNTYTKDAQQQHWQLIPACPQTIGTVSNGAITYPNPALNGTLATMSCNAGYLPASGAVTSVTCAAGTWSPASFGSCIAVCPQNIAMVANGAISYSSPSYAGTVATVACNAGYYPAAGAIMNVTCTAAGTWSSPFGACVEICPRTVAQVSNGNITYPSPAYVGTTASLTCNAGYLPAQGAATSITCAAGKNWNPSSFGACALTCPQRIPNVSNGGISYPSAAYAGTTATLTCNSGYLTPSGTSTGTTTCGADGQWSPAAFPTCAITCPQSMGSVSNGGISYPSPGFDGTIANLTCNTNYYPAIGAATSATCTADGTWIPSTVGTCAAICPQNFASVTNGDINYPATAYVGTTATLRCKPGYFPDVGAVTKITCASAGTWSAASFGTCAVTCGRNIPDVDNGAICYPTRAYVGLSANLICDDGYDNPFGTVSSAICQANGTWSPSSFQACTK